MANSAFVLPAGVEISIEGGKLSIRHDGDIVLEGTAGLEVGLIEATGDITLRLDRATGSLRAGGRIVFDGVVDAEFVHAREVHFGSANISAKAISADRKIVIGAAKLAVDVILAPAITIDPKATGRVTVIESRNERGATKIKGGFSLAEYEEVIGDAESFLAERGLQPLSDEVFEPEPEPETELEAEPETEAEPAAAEAPDAAEEEDVDDPLSLSIEDLEPLDDDMQIRLSDAVGRIIGCYANQERPPSVERLQELVGNRDYEALRQDITEVWNGLLTFHQERGLRPHHQVTHAFNVIHGLVQEA